MKLALLSFILASAINVIPQPLSVREDKGSFNLKGTPIACDAAIGEIALAAVKDFSANLTLAAGQIYPVSTPVGLSQTIKQGKVKGIVFGIDPTLKEEAYTINIDKSKCVVLASTDAGILYALQTLKQLLPSAIYSGKTAENEKWALPCCEIKDTPRFSYRGMHLDCGRHFWTVDEIKKVLDVMATLKLNRFHWHLTEDQGWRAEIKAYPELTNIGAWRAQTIIGYQHANPEHKKDGIRYGGFYTQDEMREVVAYAQKLGITVVPEIDLPGHMVAALASYPWLGCSGKCIEPGREGEDYSVWEIWGVSPDVLCPGKDTTFEFLKTVLGELCEIFPGEYFHIGGDECPKDAWAQCPDCQARIAALGLKSDEHATAEQRLQNYVTSEMQAFLATKGKKIIGWDEILEGDLQEGATVMSWRGKTGGIEASNRGFDVIMTPDRWCYFDYNQCPDRGDESKPVWEAVDEPTCAWWGTLPLAKVYSFDPTEGLSAEAASHILGCQANVWTEYIPTEEQLEYMIMPRLFAMSEVQWSQLKNKDYDDFIRRVKAEGVKILKEKNFNYRAKDELAE